MEELSDQINNNLNSAFKVYLRLKPLKKVLFVVVVVLFPIWEK